jgi:hypothetical protein
MKEFGSGIEGGIEQSKEAVVRRGQSIGDKRVTVALGNIAFQVKKLFWPGNSDIWSNMCASLSLSRSSVRVTAPHKCIRRERVGPSKLVHSLEANVTNANQTVTDYNLVGTVQLKFDSPLSVSPKPKFL